MCTRIGRFIFSNDDSYHQIYDERRKSQRTEHCARKEKDTLVRVPNRSILSETTTECCNRTQTYLRKYVVREKVETLQGTTFIHQRIEGIGKENEDQPVVQRNYKCVQ